MRTEWHKTSDLVPCGLFINALLHERNSTVKMTNEMTVAVLPTYKSRGRVMQELCSTCGKNAPAMLELRVLDEWEEDAHTFICPSCLRRMADVVDNSKG